LANTTKMTTILKFYPSFSFCLRSIGVLFSVLLSIALSYSPARSADNDKMQTYQVHTVKGGDSLSKIANEYYGDYSKAAVIAKFNNIKDIDRLNIGQKIKIPVLSLEPAKRDSNVKEVDLGTSGEGDAETLEEKSLNRTPVSSRLDQGTLFFIIIYLLVMLALILFKWKGMQDDYHLREPEDEVRSPGRRKWRL